MWLNTMKNVLFTIISTSIYIFVLWIYLKIYKGNYDLLGLIFIFFIIGYTINVVKLKIDIKLKQTEGKQTEGQESYSE